MGNSLIGALGGNNDNNPPPPSDNFQHVSPLSAETRFENAFNAEPAPQFNLNPVLVAAGTEATNNNSTYYSFAFAALGAFLLSSLIFFWKFRRKGDRYEYNVHLLVEDEEENF